MKMLHTPTTAVAFALCTILAASAILIAQATRPSDIDWNYARTLLDKEHSGQQLTADEKTYLDNAKRIHNAQAMRPQTNPAGAAATTKSTGLVPLDQMGADDRYKGEDGGLYGGGKNSPPREHQASAQKELAKVVPLDPKGNPAADGKIVLVSIGMSNTTQEFSRFKELADRQQDKSPNLVIVDGAQGGQDAIKWSGRNGTATWDTLDKRLAAAGVTARQVQVMWVKHACIQPAALGDFPKHAQQLKEFTVDSLNIARERFPNLRVAYLSSRIYAGYASTRLNPEPYAYESAFAVRWVIQDQIEGDAKLNFDAAKGQVKSPLVLWGPYLWADGATPRKSDQLVWKPEDFGPDGTHPSTASGRDKVARLLLGFFKGDAGAKGWFLEPAAATSTRPEPK
jgi:hypothetical protein